MITIELVKRTLDDGTDTFDVCISRDNGGFCVTARNENNAIHLYDDLTELFCRSTHHQVQNRRPLRRVGEKVLDHRRY